jgi:cobalt-zinc-cadmium efflux system membrane fusion protein
MSRTPILWRIAAPLVFALALSGCGDRSPQNASGTKSTSAAPATGAAAPGAVGARRASDPMEVGVQPEMSAYFKVGKVTQVDIAQTVEAAGRIEADARRVARIGAAVSGRVTEILAEVGDTVRRGQPLAEIASPELTTAQLNYLRAYSASTQAERAVDRARQLLQADVIGSAELQRRESELTIARAELRAAGDQLSLIGMSEDQLSALRTSGTLNARLQVSSSLAGVIIERKLSKGQVAQPGDSLFTVADLSSVWVVGSLPEQVARQVKPGQTVEMEVAALRGRKLTGQVIHVGDLVSAETRTIEFRTEVVNPKRELKPLMMVSMRVLGEPLRQLAIPVEAVVRENDRDHVFTRLGPDRFRLTPVELGPAVGALRPVRRGLQEGAEIAVSGAFHLNNERRRAELE